MTKKELIIELNSISNKNDDLISSLEDCLAEAKKIRRAFDELPSEESEIDDSEVEEEEK